MQINALNGGNMMLYSVIFSSSPLSPKHLTTLGTIRPVSLFGPKLRIYMPMMFNASTVSSLPLIVWRSLVWNYLPSLGECLH